MKFVVTSTTEGAVVEVSNLVVTLPQNGTVTIDVKECCCDAPGFVCEAQTNWGSSDPVKFGIIPQEDANGNVMFFPANGVGEAATDMPESVWVIQNQDGGIFVNLTRSPHLSSARGALVKIETEGQDPVELKAEVNGSGIAGFVNDVVLVAGKTYCVTITPLWGE